VTERKSNGRTIIECCRPRNKDFIRNRFLTWFQFCGIRQSDEGDFLEAFAFFFCLALRKDDMMQQAGGRREEFKNGLTAVCDRQVPRSGDAWR